MTYDPLTDDLLIAVEAAHERARSARNEDGNYVFTHLLSGFDLHPVVMGELTRDTVESHARRLAAGAELDTVLTSQFLTGFLIAFFIGEAREARRLAQERAA